MNILALDQASVTSGYAIFVDGALAHSGTFTINQSKVGKRLVKIKAQVLDLIDQYQIDYLVFEDIQMQQQNVVTYKALAEVLGVLEELASELNMPYEIVPSSSWRSALNIGGRVRADQKKAAQDFVTKQYNKSVSQDESDAICIGTYIVQKNSSAF